MDLKSEQEVNMFFEGCQESPWITSTENPLTSYCQLSTDPNVAEVIILANPPDLGLRELNNSHFVAGIYFSGNKLIIEVLPGTSQLRDFSRKTPLKIEMALGKPTFSSFKKGPITISSPNKDYYLPDGETLKPEILRLLKQINEVVFDELWFSPFHLAYRLRALENSTNIRVLEFQGRYKENLDYFLLYGLKGTCS